MPANDYWFPAKRIGWGWTLPTKWQGWVSLLAFGGLLLFGKVFVAPLNVSWLYAGYMLAVVVCLIGVCVLKGEPLNSRR